MLDFLRYENFTSTFFLTKYKDLGAGILNGEEYEVRDGLLLHKGKLLLDPSSQLIHLVLQECHSTLLGGHGGLQKTMAKVSATFTWPRMKQAVQKFVKECDVCQKMKYSTQPPGGLLQPLPIPEHIWEDLAMDFIKGLPVSAGYSAILFVVDRLSKQAHFGALPKSYSTP